MSDPHPNRFQIKLIKQVQLQRGRFITGYAQVEDLLSRMYVRALKFDEYHELPPDFPYRLETRLKRLSMLVATPGRLAAYEGQITAICETFPAFEKLRHFLVHGLVIVQTASKIRADRVEFRIYEARKGEVPQPKVYTTTVEDLTSSANTMCAWADEALMTFRDMSLKHNF